MLNPKTREKIGIAIFIMIIAICLFIILFAITSCFGDHPRKIERKDLPYVSQLTLVPQELIGVLNNVI